MCHLIPAGSLVRLLWLLCKTGGYRTCEKPAWAWHATALSSHGMARRHTASATMLRWSNLCCAVYSDNTRGSLTESDVECCNGSSSCKQEDIIIPANGGTYLKAPFDVEEWREHAHKMVDFIADRYYHKIETFPVLSQVQPGYLRTLLPDSAPENPETMEAVLADVEEKIIPGLTHWQSPNFFGLIPSSGSTASYLGEMLCTGFSIVGFSWITSPAFVELETIVLDWLGKALNLPHAFHSSSGKGGGVLQGTASEAVVVSMVAAREKTLKKLGANALEKLVVYASDQTHSSIEKACKTVEAVLADVEEKIIPGLTHWQSLNFFGLIPSSGSTASYLGEMLCTGFNIVGFSWITSPAFVELETIVLDWLGKALNLPHAFHSSSGKGGGVIQGTASEAVVVSMVAAREKTLKKLGANALEKLVVYASDQTHSSIEKACKVRQLPLRSF
eukprot:Gb_28002 [translate_table: standard]